MKILIVITLTILMTACSMRDAKKQLQPNDPPELDLQTEGVNRQNLNSGRIEINEKRDGTFVSLLWPNFEGSPEQQVNAFGDLGSTLLDLVDEASFNQTRGFELEDEAIKVFNEGFMGNYCYRFLGSGGFTLNFEKNLGPDGIVAAVLEGHPTPPVDPLIYEIPDIEGEKPSSLEDVKIWPQREGIEAGDLASYDRCTESLQQGRSASDESSQRINTAGNTLNLIITGINCAEVRKSYGSSVWASASKTDNSVNWQQCFDYFTKVERGEENRVFNYKPNFRYEIHRNWIDTNDEGMGSQLAWTLDERGDTVVRMKIKQFDQQEYSSIEAEYRDAENIEPIRDLMFSVASGKLSFRLVDPKTNITYTIEAKRQLVEGYPNKLEFGGDITAKCTEGRDRSICLNRLNGLEERSGLFQFKGNVREFE